ncbi:Rieske (2Fe-2S) protein (plasmid) [Mesorhizobium sp. B2-1-8]|uniref:Rieske (2Fe-2S) protein n=1 Tax=Mesorhizobium sp. B2-1-8 TaxID=2589967 RepID=UPI0011291EE3|nr:Rieske (2Fe-2S) protein [Mesorhizobium sp. B2-1-8]UCI22796.1 Rieske (2Fe-2S) protein [Mesorhizobium sp. B2-1-8]
MKHIVAKAADIAPGSRLVVSVKGRSIVLFNLGGEYYGLLNRCPHQAAALSAGLSSGIAVADEPGQVRCLRPGEFIRCPWHGWEFDIRTGQSYCDPSKLAVRQFPVTVEAGAQLVEGPYKAERIEVTQEDDYLAVEV